MSRARSRTDRQPADPAALALQELGGGAVVVDEGLRVRIATPEAERLLGFPIRPGDHAARILHGDAEHRPLAEALARRQAAQAIVEGALEGRLLQVRVVPLRPGGHLLLLSDAGTVRQEGAVEFHGIVTADPAMKKLFRMIERVAACDDTVLVRGETGSGKELVAQALHRLSARRDGPFRALNCAALPANLLESELFGHVRGAFTGAVRDAPGHFLLADGGTLFLDEVAELPLELQAKLLRVLETRTVIPVGGREPIPVDVRIVSATHRGLRKEVEAGRFRADLMYRLRVIPIFLPPLRERRGDVLLLAERFIARFNEKRGRRIERIAPATAALLESYDWPGNVRELQNVIAYAYAVGEGPTLLPSDLPPEFHEQGQLAPAEPAPADPEALPPEARRILQVLERVGGNRERAARILGVSRVTLWRRMRDLGLLANGG